MKTAPLCGPFEYDGLDTSRQETRRDFARNCGKETWQTKDAGFGEQDDFHERLDDLKAEVDAEIEHDRRRRFTMLGLRRGSFGDRLFGDTAVGAMCLVIGFAAVVGAIAIGLGLSIKTELAVAANT